MSNNFFNQAKRVIPGGVNSPVRAFNNMDIEPIFIDKAKEAFIYDVDGNQFIDYVLSWGPMILGHAHPEVIKQLKKIISSGTSFGAPTKLETKLARMIVEDYPAIDKIRMVNSGTEATMSAVRLARGYTDKNKVIKIIGCYHGHNDSFLVKAGSGLATAGIPGSPGIPEEFTEQTIPVPYNDIQAVQKAFKKSGHDIAALIIEPVAGNMGVINPEPGYLDFLREITRENESLLIFDEVITGYRIARGGAQELYDIKPDITCLGKIIGGGLPIGAYGGKKEIMDYIAPEGPVYQAGTLSGNPLAMTAGITTLKILNTEGVYQQLKEKTDYLVSKMKLICKRKGIPVQFNKNTAMFSQFFTEKKVTNYQDSVNASSDLFKRFFKLMLEKGIYLAPSPFESTFLSLAHSKKLLDKTLTIYQEVINEL